MWPNFTKPSMYSYETEVGFLEIATDPVVRKLNITHDWIFPFSDGTSLSFTYYYTCKLIMHTTISIIYITNTFSVLVLNKHKHWSS